jgi:hypothetical protein
MPAMEKRRKSFRQSRSKTVAGTSINPAPPLNCDAPSMTLRRSLARRSTLLTAVANTMPFCARGVGRLHFDRGAFACSCEYDMFHDLRRCMIWRGRYSTGVCRCGWVQASRVDGAVVAWATKLLSVVKTLMWILSGLGYSRQGIIRQSYTTAHQLKQVLRTTNHSTHAFCTVARPTWTTGGNLKASVCRR